MKGFGRISKVGNKIFGIGLQKMGFLLSLSFSLKIWLKNLCKIQCFSLELGGVYIEEGGGTKREV